MNEFLKAIAKSLTSSGFRHSLKFQHERIIGAIDKRQSIGQNSYLDPSVQVLGWKNVKIGRNSVVSEDTWINVNHRKSDVLSLVIGNHCFIGRRNFFSSGNLIKIGDYGLTAPDCKFLGSNHIYDSPVVPYITSGTTEDGVIEIGANCMLGAGVTILKGVKIGYGSIIGAATVVNRDMPPLSIVVGNPGRIIKRFDMQLQAWVNINDYPENGDQFLLTESEYLEILNKTTFDMKHLRIASSQRFGDL
ncbi:MAG: DapH/DapD/GlmU-related protein [Kovacikia sp.]